MRPFGGDREPRRSGSRRLLLAVCGVLTATGASAIAYALVNAPAPPPQPTAAQAGTLIPPGTAQAGRTPSTRATSAARPASPPTRVRIPSIGVNAAVDLLGLNADGTVQVPSAPDDAGWYRGSAAPGLPGAAVLLGHVDFASTGPAVFYRLGEVKPGAAVLVTRKDGTTAAFTADAVREFPKDAFPTDEVYGPTDGDAELRLITCGSWDPDQREYVGNTVVFATLDPPASPGSAPAARVPAARQHPQPR